MSCSEHKMTKLFLTPVASNCEPVSTIRESKYVAKSEFARRKPRLCSEESPEFSGEFRGLLRGKSHFTPTKIGL